MQRGDSEGFGFGSISEEIANGTAYCSRLDEILLFICKNVEERSRLRKASRPAAVAGGPDAGTGSPIAATAGA